MKRKHIYAIGTSLFLLTVAQIGTPKVSAINYATPKNIETSSQINYGKTEVESPLVPKEEKPKPKADVKPVAKVEPVVVPEPPKPVEYVVVSGDHLSKIALAHNTTWQRLFYKNLNIANENVLKVGDKLTIPLPDEVLAERPITNQIPLQVAPQAPRVAQTSTPAPRTTTAPAPQPVQRRAIAGNLYSYGYCTWYVKNMRADLPNNLGNANTWYYRAQSMGMPTGSTPRVGAVATTTAGSLGHVAYVTAVHANGTVTVSEMNYRGFAVVSTRTASANSFLYIY